MGDASADPPGENAPRFIRATRFLAPEGGYFPGLWEPVAPHDAPAVAAAQAAAGVRWVKIIGDFRSGPGGEMQLNYDPDVMATIVEAPGVDSIEHGPLMDEAMLERMAATGAAWVPTLAFLDGVQRAGGAGFPPSMTVLLDDGLALLPRALAAATAAGVPILAGSDALPPGSVPAEVAALVAYGLDPAAAIASATTSARAFLDMPGFMKGAPADLVVYRNDPREAPGELKRPEAIVFDGRRIL